MAADLDRQRARAQARADIQARAQTRAQARAKKPATVKRKKKAAMGLRASPPKIQTKAERTPASPSLRSTMTAIQKRKKMLEGL